MDTRNLKVVTSALSASWKEMGYLMEGGRDDGVGKDEVVDDELRGERPRTARWRAPSPLTREIKCVLTWRVDVTSKGRTRVDPKN
ncbi:hypothetical protein EVAR_47254_1 [Eumeta japonica]|uniref:Uncharacterized protein n=1 Tax=Eumeta variegata TaxID=151549 RepID=A0A4C1XJ91_EUMVA|nr:hypothetical protein EVAR_47254_1 [Eumeta japonica]